MRRCRSLSEPYDPGLSRQIVAYIATGMLFMLLPGTFLGVWNLLAISARHAPTAANAAWIQAHGHAQIFGWIGTFILGIGFYAIPPLRLSPCPAWAGWVTWMIWTAGVALRWAIGITQWRWQTFFPLAAAMELSAVILFALTVFAPRPHRAEQRWRTSLVIIEAAAAGMIAALLANLGESIHLARTAAGPVFPPEFDQRFLSLATWGFIVPFVWGFGSRWIPPLLGLRRGEKRALPPLLMALLAGVALTFFGFAVAGAVTIAAACAGFAVALRIFERSEREPKLRGVHRSVGVFIRSAFVWLIAATLLGVAAAAAQTGGLGGASRHALTVGFMATMVFCIGSRVLPAFFGVRRLFSTRLMFASLLLLSAGCFLRVTTEVLAYGHLAAAAWHWLPVSAILEMTAIAIFAFNMAMSLTTGTPADTILEARMTDVISQAAARR